jgi:ParB-like chromosome segregation protein Spo0J
VELEPPDGPAEGRDPAGTRRGRVARVERDDDLGTDERGRKRDLIIDAEHRWHEARSLGMKRGPAMVMRGITEAEARALTIKLYRRRGEHDADLLAAAVREIEGKLSVDDLALSLGFEEKAFVKLVATQEPPAPPAEFPEFDDTIETNHECPKCGFKFS